MTTNDKNTLAARADFSIDAHTGGKAIESLVLRGDMSGLGPVDRAKFYIQMCEGLGLNPHAQPFAYLRLNGKEVLYATRGATDSLAAIHKLTREIVDGPKVIDLAGTKLVYCVCRATHPNGRVETATATVPLVDPVNVLMKCETKAKRRATLSILGLGVLDEMELETIPAHVQEPGGGVDLSHTVAPPQGSRVALPPGIEADSARAADRNAAARADADTARRDVAPATSEGAPDPVEHDVEREAIASEAEVSPVLARFYARVAEIELPGEAVAVWMKHRTDLATLPAPDREAAWKAITQRTEEVGKMKGAKVWLKRAIAEEDARREASATTAGAA